MHVFHHLACGQRVPSGPRSSLLSAVASVGLLVISALMLCPPSSAQGEPPPPPPGTTCDIATNAMNFSIYDPSLPYDNSAVGTIGISCNLPLFLQISLITNDSCTQRYLRSGVNRLAYNLYQDSGHNIVWGSLNPICGQVLTTTAIFQSQFSVYGVIPRMQSVRAGTYSDVVTIQVNF
jgi:spore coat protein U-like protein